ncbi:MAG: MerC domain-containing protein [Alphaproteobacteria bacterium]|uniref:MerC domain-containing protein n=1 Tax=Maricaulis alexandrii TaxID=2570354 RepID=UPI0011084580|nr:MerC domain-containing protein [Maricaulis alexandrii]MCR9266569.1 MerC domain-containing protein [Alphaproteobacteria bacterium]
MAHNPLSSNPAPKAPHTHRNTLDATGVGLSFICMLHCLLLPAAASAAPMLAPELGEVVGLSHDWHLVLLALAAPVSLLGLGWGVRNVRGGWQLFAVGLFGLALMAIGASHIVPRLAETILTLSGVTILAVAHFVNWRRRSRAGHDHERDCGMCEHDHA